MTQDLINDVFNWGAARNLHDCNGDLRPQFIKLTAALGELANAIIHDDDNEVIDAIGDMLVVMIQLGGSFAMKQAETPDDYERLGRHFLMMCLTHAWTQIEHRTGETINGTFIKDQ